MEKEILEGTQKTGVALVPEDISELAENTIRNHKAILDNFHQRLLGRSTTEATIAEYITHLHTENRVQITNELIKE